jgi:hypothetical protein
VHRRLVGIAGIRAHEEGARGDVPERHAVLDDGEPVEQRPAGTPDLLIAGIDAERPVVGGGGIAKAAFLREPAGHREEILGAAGAAKGGQEGLNVR